MSENGADLAHLCGWVDDQGAVEAVLSQLPMPVFSQAAPDLKGSGEGVDIFFWEAEEKVLGARLGAHRQIYGTCVSHGWGRGVQDLILVEIAFGKEAEQWEGQVATEPIYGGSRVEIGGGRLRGDGSVGAWAAKWVNQYGVLLRKKYGKYDLTVLDEDLAREWGSYRNREGVPDELEPIAKEHPVGTVSMVTDGDDARDALCNGYPIPVCSGQGFTTTRDSNGFCRPRGSWSHCMLARGYCVAKGNRPAVPIQQSWGNSPTGNDRCVLESGREITLPQGVFMIDLDVFHGMLRQRDSFAISQFEGFPRRLDYLLI